MVVLWNWTDFSENLYIRVQYNCFVEQKIDINQIQKITIIIQTQPLAQGTVGDS